MVRSVAAGNGPSESPAEPEEEKKLAVDRWIELDLYWFDRENMERSVAQFFERTYPLYKGAAGWRGAIVCVGWMVDYIMGFADNLDQRIPLARFDVAARWPAHRRVIDLPRDRVTYAPWTYRDLQRLGNEFRSQARNKNGIADFEFGTLVLGLRQIYGCGVTGWRAEHTEAWAKGLVPGAPLKADQQRYAAYPQGIPQGTPFYRLFALQWGAVSEAVGIDALVLRDGMWGA